MRAGAEGWRSARWRGGAMAPAAAAGAGVAAPPPPFSGRRAPQAGAQQAAPVAPGWFPRIEGQFPWPWQGVDWTPGYLAFLTYVFVISSYIVNIGQPTMILAMLAITMSARDKWRITPAVVLLGIFMVLISLTFQSTEYRSYVYQPLEDMYKVCMIFIVGQSVLDNRARVRFFMFFYLGVFALFPVRGGLFNWFVYNATTQGRVGWNNLFENPNDFAALMILPLALTIAVFIGERSKLVKHTAFLGVSALPLVIFLTQSRGAILALAVGVFAFFVLQGKGRMKSVLTIGAVAGMLFILAPSSVWTRMSSLKSATESGNLSQANDSRSAEQRFEIWKVAWKVHEAFPITGVGWNAYPNAHADFARRPGINGIAAGARDAHNTYLTLLGETGYIGFFTWMTMIGLIVAAAVRAMKRIRRYAPDYAMQLKMVLLALLSFGVAGMFGTFAHVSFLYLHLALLIGLTTVANKEVDDVERGPTRLRGAR